MSCVWIEELVEIPQDAIKRELDQRRKDFTVVESKWLGVMSAMTGEFVQYLQADMATTQGEQRPGG